MKALLLCGLAAIGFTACNPEQQAAVINDYANRMGDQGDYTRPEVDLTVGCDVLHVTATGWPEGSKFIIGVAGDPPFGNSDTTANIDQDFPVNLYGDPVLYYTVDFSSPAGDHFRVSDQIGC